LRIGPGETISDGWVTHLAAPFLDAGWTPADLGHAVDYRPDGDQHRSPLRGIKKPAQWLRWRLSLWLAPFLDAGWTPADLGHAVDYRPDGDQHRSPLRGIKKPA